MAKSWHRICGGGCAVITPKEFELYEALGLNTDELLKFDREVENSIILLNYIKGDL